MLLLGFVPQPDLLLKGFVKSPRSRRVNLEERGVLDVRAVTRDFRNEDIGLFTKPGLELLIQAVVGRLLGNNNIMHMAFPQTGRTDSDKPGLFP